VKNKKLFSLQEDQKPDHLLVVDDSPDNIFLLQTILQEAGYRVSTALDGESALDQIRQFPPDLLLLDVMMPGINGYEVAKRVRENYKLPFIPILLITACKTSQPTQSIDYSADAVIHKPIDIDELMKQVNSLLGLKHSSASHN